MLPAMPHPSIAVKIDNHEDARPQVALNRTDLVFEELVEGGLTRYVAVWHSDVPDAVGPVRSIRPMDPGHRRAARGIIAYSGGQQCFVDMMKATGAREHRLRRGRLALRAGRRAAGPARRDPRRGRGGEPATIRSPPPGVQFAYGTADPLAAPAFGAIPTSHIELVFSEGRSASWDWDATAFAWLQVAGRRARPRRDGRAGPRDERRDDARRVDWPYEEVPLTVMVGSGEVWVSAAGRTAHGTWSKADDGRADRAHGRRRQPAATRAGQHLDRARAERGLGGVRALRRGSPVAAGASWTRRRRGPVTRWANTAPAGGRGIRARLHSWRSSARIVFSTHSI